MPSDRADSSTELLQDVKVGEVPEPFPGGEQEQPWKDKELLETLYSDHYLSQNTIRKGWDCSGSTISKWLDKHGIEKRSRSMAAAVMHNGPYEVPFYIHPQGTECWQVSSSDGGSTVYHHRLLAVAEWGLDAIRDMHVHHKNELRWDNRIENFELLTPSDHHAEHKRIKGIERLRIAEMYEHGDISSRKLAAHVDIEITQCTVLDIHKEFYGEDDEPELAGQTNLMEYA